MIEGSSHDVRTPPDEPLKSSKPTRGLEPRTPSLRAKGTQAPETALCLQTRRNGPCGAVPLNGPEGSREVRVEFARRCRECDDEFTLTRPPTGSKWTSLCPSCLVEHL